MAKISPVSIKYMIHAKFIAEGVVEKPDVIGALFGQTEGLLGEELEMRDLQKEGKIGRIEVSVETSDGKTTGEIEIPTCLDKSETTLIAAAIETIERIGPADAKIEVDKIEDVRGSKRDFIIDRAKKLLEKFEGGADSREISESVKTSFRMAKLQEYGTERLPAGDVSGNSIIIVEGRADVLNLLKNNVTNVIGMNGTSLPEGVKDLSSEKETTLFIDGDRGGELIAKNLIENAKVDYVAVAPIGREVEELSGKEILSVLRKRIPSKEFLGTLKPLRQQKQQRFRQARNINEGIEEKEEKEEPAKPLGSKDKEKLHELSEEIKGTRSALLLDNNLEIIRRVSISDLAFALRKLRKKPVTIVIDGTATSFIVRAAENAGCKNIVARNFAFSGETSINLLSL